MPTLGEQILEVAAQRRGIRYRYGAQGEGQNGLDCSLFMVLTYRDAGFPFPGGVRSAEAIRQACQPIDRSEVQPGDLIFFEGTYKAPGRPAPMVGSPATSGSRSTRTLRQMWDCHASNDDTDLPGVGITNLTPHYWLPLLFDVRRVPGLAGADDFERNPAERQTGPRFRVTAARVRLRATRARRQRSSWTTSARAAPLRPSTIRW